MTGYDENYVTTTFDISCILLLSKLKNITLKNAIPNSIANNLRFLIVEVSSQLAHLERYFLHPTCNHALSVTMRSGYTLNLTQRIHYDSHHFISHPKENKTEPLIFKTVTTIASSLERVSELCCECTQHIAAMQHKSCLQGSEYTLLLAQIAHALGLIEQAIFAHDTQLALKISLVEQQLKQACNQLIADYTAALKNKEFIEDLICALFVARCVEHIGDALLNISEAVISGSLGQAVNIDRYHALNEFIAQLNQPNEHPQWTVKTLAHTRSGSTVSALRKSNKPQIVAVFKDGTKRKLQEEQQRVGIWHQIYPGIAPRILSYNSRGNSAALLIEHLQGQTFENLLLYESLAVQQTALTQLCTTLQSIWQTTKHKTPVCAHFMTQLKRRLTDVYRLHPDFKQPPQQVGNLTLCSFKTLLKQAQHYERHLKPCFSVYIHGDFNSDNVLYDPIKHKINFIDLHRSGYMDYVQDVSVFMVSNYRLQVVEKSVRHNILTLTLEFYRFAAAFAQQNGDDSFELRLALGLARSFASSTRFILDKTLATAMFMRARYLIEQVLSIMDNQQHTAYRVPIQEIFIG